MYYMFGSKRLTLNPPTISFEAGCLTEAGALPSQQAPRILLSLPLKQWHVSPNLPFSGFKSVCKSSNSGPHVSMEGTLPTEPFLPCPLFVIFKAHSHHRAQLLWPLPPKCLNYWCNLTAGKDCLKATIPGAGEMTQCLGALTALTEDFSFVPSSHRVTHCNARTRGSDSHFFLASTGTRHTCEFT